MHVNARLVSLRPPAAELLARMLPAHDYPRSNGWCAVPLADPALARVLAACDDVGGLSVGGETVFAPAELRHTTHFEVVCRMLARERPRDYEHNAALVRATPTRDAGGYRPIRLPAGFLLTRAQVKPNAAAMIGDWTGEYVLGPAAAGAIVAAGCNGFSLRPVYADEAGRPFAGGMQIYSEAITPPVLLDASVNEVDGGTFEEAGLRQPMGCLAYGAEDLAGCADFSRTAEPWGSAHGMPAWIVTRTVVDTWKKNRLRGWHFRPVLLGGTDVYERYVDAWQTLRAMIASTATSRIHAGRW